MLPKATLYLQLSETWLDFTCTLKPTFSIHYIKQPPPFYAPGWQLKEDFLAFLLIFINLSSNLFLLLMYSIQDDHFIQQPKL